MRMSALSKRFQLVGARSRMRSATAPHAVVVGSSAQASMRWPPWSAGRRSATTGRSTDWTAIGARVSFPSCHWSQRTRAPTRHSSGVHSSTLVRTAHVTMPPPKKRVAAASRIAMAAVSPAVGSDGRSTALHSGKNNSLVVFPWHWRANTKRVTFASRLGLAKKPTSKNVWNTSTSRPSVTSNRSASEGCSRCAMTAGSENHQRRRTAASTSKTSSDAAAPATKLRNGSTPIQPSVTMTMGNAAIVNVAHNAAWFGVCIRLFRLPLFFMERSIAHPYSVLRCALGLRLWDAAELLARFRVSNHSLISLCVTSRRASVTKGTAPTRITEQECMCALYKGIFMYKGVALLREKGFFKA